MDGIEVTLDYIKRDVTEIKQQLQDSYVTHDEFKPIKNIVYGLVSLILIGVMGAIIATVIK